MIESSSPVRAAAHARKRRRPAILSDEVISEDEPVVRGAKRRAVAQFIDDEASDEEEENGELGEENGTESDIQDSDDGYNSDEGNGLYDSGEDEPVYVARPRLTYSAWVGGELGEYSDDDEDFETTEDLHDQWVEFQKKWSERGPPSRRPKSQADLPPARSKRKVHIPKSTTPRKDTIEFGTQKPPAVSSSPWRMRDPHWVLPRNMDPSKNPQVQARDLSSSPIQSPSIQRRASPARRSVSSSPAFESPPPNDAEAQTLRISQHSVSDSPSQSRHISQAEIDLELADLPSDAFDSSDAEAGAQTSSIDSTNNVSQLQNAQRQANQRLVAPQTGLRQMTLFGSRLDSTPTQTQSQRRKVYNYRQDKPPEPPTHHELDQEAMQTWVYPTNLGAVRDYQYSIVKNGLFNNLLVALPTGLGKTFIAATIMLNYFRWTKSAQIVFVAPTKPLVAQQVDACFHTVGIPRSTTTLLTGEVQATLRAEEWATKRVFFMTPQTLENDLRTGIADSKRIVLLVVDEAHRATGKYAYVKVVELMRQFNKSFRILALTATPGNTVEAVQEVIDGLGISQVEIRTEDSIDIQPYVHGRNIDQVLFDPSDEMMLIQELWSKALQPLVDQLAGQNAYYNRDPMTLTNYGLILAQKRWMGDRGRTANPGLKGMMAALFATLKGLAHSIKLLTLHGMRPFYDFIKEFRSEALDAGRKVPKNQKRIVEHEAFKKMLDHLDLWVHKPDFISHPKLSYLSEVIMNHFLDAGNGTSSQSTSNTRVIVFAEYRSSAEEIVRVLNQQQPMIKASVFVGQAATKNTEGMTQAKQQETIENFKKGKYNVLVATSIGEEGLDIGQVDLIICFDSSASPIRMLQRMGRTGRKRAGNIVLLLMRGKEQESFVKAKHNYETMQRIICAGDKFNFRYDLSTRIVPADVQPAVDKRIIEIPIENTQDPNLPEPKRRGKGRAPKRPPKKFHMPDGVETGFVKASKLTGKAKAAVEPPPPNPELFDSHLQQIPPEGEVVLSRREQQDLELRFLTVATDEEIGPPALDTQHEAQRSLTPCGAVAHGNRSTRYVEMIHSMRAISNISINRFKLTHESQDLLGRADWLQLPYDQKSEALGSALEDLTEGAENNEDEEDVEADTQEIGGTVDSDQDMATNARRAFASNRGRGRGNKRGRASSGRTGISRQPRNSRQKRRRNLDPLENGDSCSDSDQRLPVPYDDESDLSDFVVGDNEDIMFDHSGDVAASDDTMDTSPPDVQPRYRQNKQQKQTQRDKGKATEKENLFFEPTFRASQLTNDDDDDDDMPDIAELVSTSRARSRAGGGTVGRARHCV